MKYKTLYLFILSLIIAIVLFSIVDIYFIKSDLLIGKFSSEIIPFPAIYINKHFVTVKDYNTFLCDYKTYFLFDTSKTEDYYRQSAIKQLIGVSFINNLAMDLDVGCYRDKAFYEFKNDFYIQNNINGEVILDLKNKYGFEEDKFEKYVILPSYCRIKISNKLFSFDANREKRKQIDEIYSAVVKNPDTFSEYSDKYNDKNIPKMKELGWLAKSDLPDGIIDLVDNMKILDISPVIESIAGYHIYRMDAIVKDDKNNQNFYQLSQIFIPIKNFDDYVNEYLTSGKFKILIN